MIVVGEPVPPEATDWLTNVVTWVMSEHTAGHLTPRNVTVLLAMAIYQAAGHPPPTIKVLANDTALTISAINDARTYALQLGLLSTRSTFPDEPSRPPDPVAEAAVQNGRVRELAKELLTVA